MKKAIRYIKVAIPFLHLALVEFDEDSKGARVLNYVADVLEAFVDGKPIPQPPKDINK